MSKKALMMSTKHCEAEVAVEAVLPRLPVKVRLPHGPDTFGLSRSAIYRAAAAGHVTLTKLGRTTLIDTASMLAFLDGLPKL